MWHLKSWRNFLEPEKTKSERYLDIASHYNDVKVPEQLQRQIGAKVSKVIDKNIEFVDIQQNGIKWVILICFYLSLFILSDFHLAGEPFTANRVPTQKFRLF